MTRLALDPLAAIWLIGLIATLAVAATVWLGGRGRALRAAACTALVLVLLNPGFVREDREPLSDIAVLIVDNSESLTVDDRAQAAAAVADALRAQANGDPLLDLVEAELTSDADGTALQDALAASVGGVPRDRLSAVIAVTDGQIHDLPGDPASLGLEAPFHAVIVGDPARGDRRLVVKRAPAYAIVGETAQFSLTVEDPAAPDGALADVALFLDGDEKVTDQVPIGRELTVSVPIGKRGPNVVEIVAAAGPDELTMANNRAAVNVNGVRDRLRVLLITGAPYPGARAWRDLLKSDPSVDLVHFTILRDPEKAQDRTPNDELALIEFPHRELFEDKITDFDLVIFDNYKRKNSGALGPILRPHYFTGMTRYVEAGGAMLIAAGPPFAGDDSLHRTALSVILPARPTREITEGGFRPRLSDTGQAHPVTTDFAGLADAAIPDWGRWFRRINAEVTTGEVLMEAEDGGPLLVLDRVENGRVALLLSDHAWLWRRGVDGGGPHTELFRRLAHWLMQEPELEEERLTADIAAGVLSLTRRTTGAAPEPVVVTTPSGGEFAVALEPAGPGLYRGSSPINETGLHRARSGDVTAVAASGPLNPVEFADLRATDALLTPLTERTSGGVVFAGTGDGVDAPAIRRTRVNEAQAGRGWIGLPRRNAAIAREQTTIPLLPALLGLALAFAAIGAAWYREGR